MRIICTLALFFLIGATATLQAQEIFVKLTGPNGVIAGGSLAEGYRDHVESKSFAQATNGSCPFTGGTSDVACKVTTGNFFFVVQFDKALNPLRQLMYRGTPLTRVDVFFDKRSFTGEKTTPYYTIRLDEVYVVSVTEAQSNGELNTVQVELAPRKIGWTYFTPSDDGRPAQPVKFGWDVSANKDWTF